MNIWIETPFDNHPWEGFRRQRYWLMAEAFVAAGHKVVYWTSNFNHGTKSPRKISSSFVCTAIETRFIPTHPYVRNISAARVVSHLAYALSFARHACREAAVHPPDLVISAAPTLSAAFCARRIARRCHAPFVLDVQDAWPETFERLLSTRFRFLLRFAFFPLRVLARFLYRKADLVTGVCRRYQSLVDRDDYYCAPLGMVRASFSRVSSSAAKTETRLVYIGNLGAGYDLKTVIEAVRRESTWTLDIAGHGPQEAALRTYAADMPRVRFHGFLTEEPLRELLGRCDVGVIPMRDDSWVGLPNKLGDYLAAELSVVTSLTGECADLLARTQRGAVYARGSVESLREAVCQARAMTPLCAGLPDELDAAVIYPKYVQSILQRVCTTSTK